MVNPSFLLNGEGKAYDIANAKLKAYIESKKQERDAAKQDKIDASKEKFDNNAYENDGWFAFDISAEKMREQAKIYQGMLDYFNNLPDDSEIRDKFKDADEYAQRTMAFMASSGSNSDFDAKGWADYWDEQVKVAYEAFDAVIEDYEGYGGQDFLKNMISNMVRSGADFTEISDAIQAVTDNKQMQETINTYWESLVNPDIDSEKALENVKKAFEEIIKLYPGLEGFFDGVYERIVSGSNKVADSIEDNTTKATASLSDLSKASKGISSLASAFDEVYDKGYVSLDTISSIKEAVGDSVQNWSDYEHILMTAKEGSSELNQALSDLTYKILDNTFAEKDLSAVTEEEVAAVLRENGVKNDSVIAHEYLTQAKIREKIATYDGTDASYEMIKGLFEEKLSAEEAKTAIAQLTIAKILFNNEELNTRNDIEQIINLAETARLSVQTLADFKRAKEELTDGFVGAPSPTTQSIIDGSYVPKYNDKSTTPKYEPQALKKRQDEAEKLRKEAIKKKKDYADKVSDINKDLAEKEAQFAEDMAEAWEKEHLEQFKDNLKQYENIINQFKEKIDVTDSGLDLIEPDDFTTKADLLSLKLNQVTTYGAAMRQEFDRLCSITPQTADEAEELASRIQTLGSDMRDNVSTLRETQVAIQKLRIEAISSILDSGVGQLEAELDRIDRRLKILNSDNSEDYRYVKKALDMDRQLPLMSDFKTQRNAKSRENRALISAEQDKQDKINAIVTRSLQMQAEANAAARAKERANLIKDMEDARADAAKKLKEATEDYIEFLKENKLYTDKTAKEIEDIIKQTDLTFPEPDISSVTSAFDNIKSGIQEVADMVDGLEINIQGSASVSTGEGAGGGGGSIPSGGIPVGAAVYFQSKDPNGHVGIMGSDGYIYHDEGGKISRNKLSEMSSKGYTYRGYGWNGGVALSAEEAAKVAAVAQDSTSYGVIPRNKACQAWVMYTLPLQVSRVSAKLLQQKHGEHGANRGVLNYQVLPTSLPTKKATL